MTDVFSKYTQAIQTRDQTATHVSGSSYQLVSCIWSSPPIALRPRRLFWGQSDRLQQACSIYDIVKTRTSPYRPQGNGQCKQFNRTVHDLLRTLPQNQKNQWAEHLAQVVLLMIQTNINPQDTPHTCLCLDMSHSCILTAYGDQGAAGANDIQWVDHESSQCHDPVYQETRWRLQIVADRWALHHNVKVTRYFAARTSAITVATWDATRYSTTGPQCCTRWYAVLKMGDQFIP